MTKRVRVKVAHWFFLLIGMIGVGTQLYNYINKNLDLNINEVVVTLFFGMFIFRPMILLDLIDDFRVKFLNAKNRIFKIESTPVDDDEDSGS